MECLEKSSDPERTGAMGNKLFVVAFDTSNYKTSVAAIHRNGSIKADLRRLLHVKQGEKGLRQSEAIFQHMENLPLLISEIFASIKGEEVAAVAASDKPRRIEGSYMPCFKAGEAFGSALASVLNVPYFRFSHQEGHLEAVKEYSIFKDDDQYLAMHLSGGTTEILRVSPHIEIIGGTKDISFGQTIDRAGVLLGMNFPCGEEMDAIAMKEGNATNFFKPIPIEGSYINLSGLDTQVKRTIETMRAENSLTENVIVGIIKEIFDKIALCLIQLIKISTDREGINKVLLAGGVSSSKYIRSMINQHFRDGGVFVDFGSHELASDNAVGIGHLGRKSLWPENL